MHKVLRENETVVLLCDSRNNIPLFGVDVDQIGNGLAVDLNCAFER